MSADPRGTLLFEFPQTMSFKNWPFLVALAFLAGVFGYGGWASGHAEGGAFIAAGVLFVPFVVVLVQVFGGFFVARVTSVWTHGLVVRRFGADALVPWSEVKRVGFGQAFTGPIAHPFIVLELSGQTFHFEPMSRGLEAAVEIAARAGLRVEELPSR